MKSLLFIVFVNVYIQFRIWIRIRNPRFMDLHPAKVTDPCGSRSTTLSLSTDDKSTYRRHIGANPAPLLCA
jgi:hypothetical protein